MKAAIIRFLIISFFSSVSSASELSQLNCKLDEHTGLVSMHGVYSYMNEAGSLGVQQIVSWIGYESFSDPYRIRTNCELLKSEITSFFQDAWLDDGCDDASNGIYKKSIGFQLTQKGKTILGKSTGVIWFLPEGLILSAFKKRQYAPACDPL